LLQEKQGKANEATKSFERAIEETKDNQARVIEASQFLMENGKADWAEKLFVEARKKAATKPHTLFNSPSCTGCRTTWKECSTNI
jgi:DNA-directed RNA polymerase subunit M/transcription elongation factor TFIIS